MVKLCFAQDKRTFGDVRVTLYKGPLGPSSILIVPEPELDAEVVACVDRAVREAARHALTEDGIDHGALTLFMVGQPAAVLPPLEDLLDDWRSRRSRLVDAVGEGDAVAAVRLR